MLSGPALEDLVATVARVCRSGLDPDQLRAAVLSRLRRAVPVDALWWAAADPATLLFTGSHAEGLPVDSGPYFLRNEFLRGDVNTWTDLARTPTGVDTLVHATDGHPEHSERYREFFAPLGLQDELRVVLRVRGACWGYLCLHRGAARSAFSHEEAAFVHRLAPHIAEGIRLGMVRAAAAHATPVHGPGLVLLTADGTVAGMNRAAPRWLEELGGDPDGSTLPIEVSTLVVRLQADLHGAVSTRLVVRTRRAQWAVLHASRMLTADDASIAVIVEAAGPVDVAPVLMAAYGLTARERNVLELVCQGLSTRVIGGRLHLTTDTVQDHLTSMFDRTGVHSRGELVATIMRRGHRSEAVAAHPGRAVDAV